MNVSLSSQWREEAHSAHAIAYYGPRYRAGSGRLRPAMWNDDLPDGNPLLEIDTSRMQWRLCKNISVVKVSIMSEKPNAYVNPFLI